MPRLCSECREKTAIYARAGAEKALRCGGCRVAGDVNVADKKCGCGKRPSFGPRGGKKMHCAGCRVEGDVNLRSKMCSTCGEKRPTFSPAGAEKPLRCGGCRVAGDVDVVNKKCECGKQPSFGPRGGKRVHCAGSRPTLPRPASARPGVRGAASGAMSMSTPACALAAPNTPILAPRVAARTGAATAGSRATSTLSPPSA
jgi:hypothetical protein